MSHLPRLLKIFAVAAKYRLHTLSPLTARSWLVRLFMAIIGLPWTGSAARRLSPEQRLRRALEELGPIYIKFGQLLSTRRDFLPHALADELQSLQDRVPGFTSPSITTIVEAALESPWQNHFSHINNNALASASIAQVHEATLLNGDQVVIKVLRPGISETIRQDIVVLKWLARLIERHVPDGRRLRPREVIADYEHVILGELNLMSEGANTTLLRRNFEHSSLLYVPQVYWDVSRDGMLVTERINGIPVSDVTQLTARQVDLKKLAETGVEIFFTQVFEHSFFHADMHPGNIFVDATDPQNPRYIAIDCAIIGSLSREDQQYLARNLLAIFKRDYRKVAELHVECGWVPKTTKVVEFEAAMRTVCEPIFEKPLKDISFGYLLVQLFRTAGRFNMEVQPSLVLLQKTLLNVEGLGRQLYPELDLWQTALPFLESWNRRRMKPSFLWRELKNHVPDWVEQFPHLPQLVLNSLHQQDKLQALNDTLQTVIGQQRQQEKRRRRNTKRLVTATVVIVLLAAFLYFTQ
ncbi:ubiquinone biosynthesis regulatory protein kinase UbiB [Pseudohongiella acticola]|uniref:Ubiquinone biosynthesis regulatory protein kinase UbiB n=1 Tax=Pseudohongiella acticola TaxID=1524254 RepID=A0A1E8CK84_9GAMM|nr:ubiquinone biosynthesis regulatory protein kinase UbiB [Pseudohongiella acticola]OFE12870.1 ubiquinone biosynthesis regulatory protein kinase UbiB [Pseudohongiella acticola]